LLSSQEQIYGSFALSGYAGAVLRLAGSFREQPAQLTANGGGGCVDDLRQIAQLRQGWACSETGYLLLF